MAVVNGQRITLAFFEGMWSLRSTTSKLTKTSPNSKRLTFMEEDIHSHLKVNPWS
jgi:hypothetical protein